MNSVGGLLSSTPKANSQFSKKRKNNTDHKKQKRHKNSIPGPPPLVRQIADANEKSEKSGLDFHSPYAISIPDPPPRVRQRANSDGCSGLNGTENCFEPPQLVRQKAIPPRFFQF